MTTLILWQWDGINSLWLHATSAQWQLSRPARSTSHSASQSCCGSCQCQSCVRTTARASVANASRFFIEALPHELITVMDHVRAKHLMLPSGSVTGMRDASTTGSAGMMPVIPFLCLTVSKQNTPAVPFWPTRDCWPALPSHVQSSFLERTIDSFLTVERCKQNLALEWRDASKRCTLVRKCVCRPLLLVWESAATFINS